MLNIIVVKYGADKLFADRLKKILQNILSDLQLEYPFFLVWLHKVFEELRISEKRIILICCDSDNVFDIKGVAILKNTLEERKICTLRVLPPYRHQGIGTLLLKKSIEILKDQYPLITVSGIHMNSFGPFLRKNGFVLRDKIKSIYRRGCYEYFYNVPYQHKVVLLSIRPEYIKQIIKGIKKVEFRKKIFSKTVKKVVVYSSSPQKRIIGYFEVTKITVDTPSQIWNQYKQVGGISKEKYEEYYKNKEQAYAIEIDQFVCFSKALNPLEFDSKFRPPQSFCYVDNVEFLKWLNI